jgi:hypothetical protein
MHADLARLEQPARAPRLPATFDGAMPQASM